jgi:hypothetical protein
MRCAALYWLYLSLRRGGRDDEARAALDPVHASMEIIENASYHQLLLLYKGAIGGIGVVGDIAPGEVVGGNSAVAAAIDDATMAYGLAIYRWLAGDRAGAQAAFRAIVARDAWPAFGHLAAEAELARGGWR